MTDERLMECSAATTGVYIRLMCVFHKSEDYGTILLKQKFKQTDEQTKNFALQLDKYLPYDFDCIHAAICELVDEKVLTIDGDFLIQKRMVKDAIISEKRSQAGKKGGVETQKEKKKPKQNFAKAKTKANSEYEIEYENEIKIEKKEEDKKEVLPELKVAWQSFEEMRKKMRKPMTDRASTMLKKKSLELAKGDESLAAKIINQSTMNGWADVYPLKEVKTQEVKKSKIQTAIDSHNDFMAKITANEHN